MLPHSDQHDQGFEYLTPEKLELIFKYLEDQSNLVQLAPTSAPVTPSEASPSPVSTPLAEPVLEPTPTLPIENNSKVPSDARALYNMFALPLARSCGESTELMSISQKSQGKVHLHKETLSISHFVKGPVKTPVKSPRSKSITRAETSNNCATYLKNFSPYPKTSCSFQAFDLGGKLIKEKALFSKKKRHVKRTIEEPTGRGSKPFKSSRVRVKKLPKVGTGDGSMLEYQVLLDS